MYNQTRNQITRRVKPLLMSSKFYTLILFTHSSQALWLKTKFTNQTTGNRSKKWVGLWVCDSLSLSRDCFPFFLEFILWISVVNMAYNCFGWVLFFFLGIRMLLFGLSCDFVWVSIWVVVLFGLDFSFYFVEGAELLKARGPNSTFSWAQYGYIICTNFHFRGNVKGPGPPTGFFPASMWDLG